MRPGPSTEAAWTAALGGDVGADSTSTEDQAGPSSGAQNTLPCPDSAAGAVPLRPVASPAAALLRAARRRHITLPMPPPGAAGLVRGPTLTATPTAAPLEAVVEHLKATRCPALAVALAGRTETLPSAWDAAHQDCLALEGRELVPSRLLPLASPTARPEALTYADLVSRLPTSPEEQTYNSLAAGLDDVWAALDTEDPSAPPLAGELRLALARMLLPLLGPPQAARQAIALIGAVRRLSGAGGAMLCAAICSPAHLADGRMGDLAELCVAAAALGASAAGWLQASIASTDEGATDSRAETPAAAARHRRDEMHRLVAAAQNLASAAPPLESAEDKLATALAACVDCQRCAYPPDADLLTTLRAQARRVLALGTEDGGDRGVRRGDAARIARGAARGRIPSPEGVARAMAVVVSEMRRVLGIEPYPVQLLAALAMASPPVGRRGRLAQMRTGEGKSVVVALAAGFHALMGRAVDIISSSRPLAVRDQRRFAPFYAALGVAAAHICDDDPPKEAFAAPVLFGTGPDFEWALMRDLLSREKKRLFGPIPGTLRPRQVAIVDEVDNLFLDRGDEPSVISLPSSDPARPLVVPIYAHVTARGAAAGRPAARDVQALRTALAASNANVRRAAALTSDAVLRSWMSSCHQALFELEEGRHYIAQTAPRESNTSDPGQVVIIDPATSQPQPNSRWNRRLHQFVELKHNFEVRAESQSAAQVRHTAYFGAYAQVFGLSGTLGGDLERQELGDVFSLDCFDLPPHRPSQRATPPPLQICPTPAAFAATICREARAAGVARRPCLVLTATVSESAHIARVLERAGAAPRMLNALQPEAEDLVVAGAGRAGALTVGTHVAGRGTDIVIDPEVAARGGLHVVVSFFADCQRVEAQAIGRAARQGQRGSYAIVLGPQEAAVVRLGPSPTPAGLEAARHTAEAERVAARRAHGTIGSAHQRVIDDYFTRLSRWHTATAPEQFTDLKGGRNRTATAEQAGLTNLADAAAQRLGPRVLAALADVPAYAGCANDTDWLRGTLAALDALVSLSWGEFLSDVDDLTEALYTRHADGGPDAATQQSDHEQAVEDRYQVFLTNLGNMLLNPMQTLDDLVAVGSISLLGDASNSC